VDGEKKMLAEEEIRNTEKLKNEKFKLYIKYKRAKHSIGKL
jgi:hypothetical protein